MPQLDEWQLVVATPWYDSKGPREANRLIINAFIQVGVYEHVPMRRFFVKSPNDPTVHAMERELKFKTEGSIHILKHAPLKYSVIFTPYTGPGSAVPSVQVPRNDAEFREFLQNVRGGKNWPTLAVQFETRLSLLYEILERSSPSRVRFAAQQRRALDCCGPFQEPLFPREGKPQNGKGPVRRQSGPIFHCHRHFRIAFTGFQFTWLTRPYLNLPRRAMHPFQTFNFLRKGQSGCDWRSNKRILANEHTWHYGIIGVRVRLGSPLKSYFFFGNAPWKPTKWTSFVRLSSKKINMRSTLSTPVKNGAILAGFGRSH